MAFHMVFYTIYIHGLCEFKNLKEHLHENS